ncbi:MAG: tetratricopeptide repeat protein [Gammaproteobacteria bacterium]|nr:tetratricopeptide repeat protein [Gammaproteobacteria bacterium]
MKKIGDKTELSIEEAVEVAIHMHKKGMLDQSEAMYQAILNLQPGNLTVMNLHGVVLHQLGRSAEGLQKLEQCVAADPSYIDAWSNLGNILSQCGKLDEAESAYRQVLTTSPSHANALSNLAALRLRRGDQDTAIECLERCLEANPEHAEAWFNLARLYAHFGQDDKALAASHKAVEFAPTANALNGLARAVLHGGDVEQAKAVLRRCRALHPDDPISEYHLKLLTDKSLTEAPSEDYVRKLFDDFSAAFDSVLEKLDYRVPDLIGERLSALQRSWQSVLDAGCGTGLCGPHIKPWSSHLVGIDLSTRMLQLAQDRDVYDRLEEAELTAYFNAHPDEYDLVVSGDTLIYFSDLSLVFDSLGRTLRPGATALFTLEKLPDTSRDFAVSSSGRYRHSLPYIEQSISDAGLGISSIVEQTLRMERANPVEGYLIQLGKGS